MPVAGFGPLTLNNILLNGKALSTEWQASIVNIYLQRTIMGASTVTIQLADPYRQLLRNMIKQGATLNIDGLSYTLVQFMKASDQIQLVFESTAIYRLSHQTGMLKVVGKDTTEFMLKMTGALGIRVVGPDYKTIWSKLTTKPIFNINMQRGTTADKNENSWTAMNRLASSIGWRLWENAGVIYFGPDEYWLGTVTDTGVVGQPPINKAMGKLGQNFPVLQEFTNGVQLMDFDWDVGKPFGMVNVTCLMDNFDFQIGEVVRLQGMGPADGYWLVYGMQRDFFNPQATLTLQAPMPIGQYIDPTSLPLKGLPLQPVNTKYLK